MANEGCYSVGKTKKISIPIDKKQGANPTKGGKVVSNGGQ